MASKNRNKNNNRQGGGQPGRQGGQSPSGGTKQPTPSGTTPSTSELLDSALDAVTREGVDESTVPPPAAQTVSEDDLRWAAGLYMAAAKAAKDRETALTTREAQLEDRERAIQEDKDRINEDKRAIQEDKTRNGNERAELERRLKALESEEKELLERITEAERRASELTAEVYKKAHDEVIAPLLETRAAIVEGAREQLAGTMARLSEQAAQLEQRQLELDRREREVAAATVRLSEDRREWEQEKTDTESDAVAEARRQQERERRKAARLEQEVDRLRETELAANDLRNTLGTDPASFVQELDGMRDRVRELEAELRRRPPESLNEQLQLVEARAHHLSTELSQALSENERFKADISSTQNLALERDRLTRENSALLSTTAAFEKRVEELKRQFDNLVKQSSDLPPFPECTAMDSQPSLQAAPTNVRDEPPALDKLVVYLQQTMAHRSREDGPPLYFRLDDLRIFLGGMAMSRLHILEGVSGTGKTSLPIAVAQALGGRHAKIEVQAGWRDNRDLLGYYNEFEKHFREHVFTRSLYEALTPRYRTGLYFVVLDEMNLSKPEQYFADYLSLLEDREGADQSKIPAVKLNDQSVEPLPKHMHRPDYGGVELPLGNNVWFIGTANHDETTASFAPKTQSRAHMMELPRKVPDASELAPKQGTQREWGKVLGHEALLQQFDEAAKEHRKIAAEADGFFRLILDVLEDFDDELSWGPRITRQIHRFVPTVVAAGGSMGLAVDHLLYTKLTRRLRDGFSPEMRNARKLLLQGIRDYWPCRDSNVDAAKAVLDLERQISRG
jgi:hypothetical protein